jgi:hypothetical protein
MRRRVLVVAAAAIIALYVLATRPAWFDGLEREVEVGAAPIYSDVVDVSEAHEFIWRIPRVPWTHQRTESRLSMEVDWRACRVTSSTPSATTLRVRVKALAHPESGGEFDRLVHNWYYRTDDPLAPDARMWRTFSAESTEYGLAGVLTYPWEDLSITLAIVNPDPQLSSCRPRLKLVGEHDYAVAHHLPQLRLLRDAGIALCMGCVLYLTAVGWKQGR